MRIFFTLFFTLLIGVNVSAQNEPLKVGDIAPPIEVNTIDDEAFSLSSLKGKVVLIDFWASWCAPCRKEQPELLELYRQVEEKHGLDQFEILGVSLDMEKKDWVRAVEMFNIPWPQVSDLKFWRSEVAADYNLSDIPYNLIIDGEGKIIATNLHDEELNKFILSQFE